MQCVCVCVCVCVYVCYRIDDYTMQVTGEESYIFGNVELIAFRHIRKYVHYIFICCLTFVCCCLTFVCCLLLLLLFRCIVKAEPIHLSVTEKPPIEVERPHKFSVS